MAIYHLHVKNISRGDGRSAVAAAAYRAGETLPNEAEERDSAFGGRRDVIHAEIRTPDGAPAWMADRATLWNGVEKAEKRKDSRLAKEIEFALPRELPRDLWLTVAREMADAYTSRGYVADFAIHDDGAAHNPHVHMMLTTREITGEGFGKKLREADAMAFVKEARALWAGIANAALAKAGAGVAIDDRSHAARGIDQAPTVHRGADQAERAAKRDAREQGERMGNDRDNPDMTDRLAALEAENRLLRERLEQIERTEQERLPVPDPDGRPITQEELQAAEDRMTAEVEKPTRDVPQPPHPARAPQDERTAARDEKMRENLIDIPDERARDYRLTPQNDPLAWAWDDSAPERDPFLDREPERERGR